MIDNSRALRSAGEIIDRAREIGWSKPMKLAVAAANDRDVLSAVVEARMERIVEPVLVGDKEKIVKTAEELSLDITGIPIYDIKGEAEAAAKTAELAADNEVQIVMKGFLQTSTLLKTILKPEYRLKLHNTISHCAVLTVPGYHKLLNITDGGMVLEPDLQQKLYIIKNAVLVSNALGIQKPKIALHAASDMVNPHMPSSIVSAVIAKMAQRMQLGDVLVDGPLTLDCALMPGVAIYAGIESQVAGDADVLVVSSIEEGNIISKAMINFGDAIFAGVVVGAKVPISLVSRTDSSMHKKASIALSVVLADYICRYHRK